MKLQDIMIRFAAHMMPQDQTDWAQAMQVEFKEIIDMREQRKFALGCLSVSVRRAAQTRKGLSFIGRGLVAMGLTSLVFAILVIAKFETPQAISLFTALGFFYGGAAALTILNLKGLGLYASLGFGGAAIAWLALKFTNFGTVDLPNIFLKALSFEVMLMTGGLIICSIYFSLINAQDETAL